MWHALSFHSGYFRESKKPERKNNLLFEINLIFWRKAPHFVCDDDDDDAFGKIVPTRGFWRILCIMPNCVDSQNNTPSYYFDWNARWIHQWAFLCKYSFNSKIYTKYTCRRLEWRVTNSFEILRIHRMWSHQTKYRKNHNKCISKLDSHRLSSSVLKFEMVFSKKNKHHHQSQQQQKIKTKLDALCDKS